MRRDKAIAGVAQDSFQITLLRFDRPYQVPTFIKARRRAESQRDAGLAFAWKKSFLSLEKSPDGEAPSPSC